nr:MAG TPA: hypothetical protein [Caudoviricetes sp.]
MFESSKIKVRKVQLFESSKINVQKFEKPKSKKFGKFSSKMAKS